MDRNILRRTPLIIAFLNACLLLGGSETITIPRRTVRITAGSRIEEGIQPLPPLQTHAAAKAWSYDVRGILEENPEISYWVEQWSSEDGLRKYITARERSRLFHHDVVSLIRSAKLPPEVAAIPVVESNWRVDAVSSSAAGGPWQFLESSARGRMLQIDVWHDERKDPWRATEAAIKELEFYRRLQGDWLLAIASYNAGPTRIRKIRQASGYNDFWSLNKAGVLPVETQGYVPQVMAVAYIAAHEGRLGIEPGWEPPPEWIRLPLERSVLLRDVAANAEIDLSTLLKLHPELHFPVTPPPGGSYRIKIPAQSEDAVKTWIQGLESTGAPLRFWRYTVKSGDTLSALAEKNGISLAELVHYNSMNRNPSLRIGERILLPGDTAAPEGSETDDLPNWQGRYRVAAGDSLWSVAQRFGITPEALAEANHRPVEGVLLSGSVLYVPESKVDQ